MQPFWCMTLKMRRHVWSCSLQQSCKLYHSHVGTPLATKYQMAPSHCKLIFHVILVATLSSSATMMDLLSLMT